MAGSVTITEETAGYLKKVKFDWTSGTGADAGKADGQTTKAYTGEIIRLITKPDGVAVPTNLYDIVIEDEDTFDTLMGAGADRSSTATEQKLASVLGCCKGDKLYLHVTNAGDTKKGICIIYIR
jgi:hypothetical protein